MVERQLGALADDVRAQVRTPSFDTLAGQAIRRRRRVRITAVGAVVAAVLGLVAGVDHVVGTSNPGREAAERPDRGAGQLTLGEVVHDPDAELIGFAVSASDPNVRAAMWHLCLDKWCNRLPRVAVAVTDDGFDTSTYVNPPGYASDLTSIDADTFAMSSPSRVWLLDTDGAIRQLPPHDPVGPVEDGEVLVYTGPTGDDPLAIDPVSETAHRLPMPTGDYVQVQQAPDGRLWGSAVRNGSWYAVWSTVGGANWAERRMGDYPNVDFMNVYNISSFAPGVMAYIEVRQPGGYPLDYHRSTDGGETWQHFPASSLGDLGPLQGSRVVRSDGSLWVMPTAYKGPDAGPYLTAGTDWSRLDRTEPGFPDEMQNSRLNGLLPAGLDADGTLVLYVSTGVQKPPGVRDQQLFVSTDGGSTWELSAAR